MELSAARGRHLCEQRITGRMSGAGGGVEGGFDDRRIVVIVLIDIDSLLLCLNICCFIIEQIILIGDLKNPNFFNTIFLMFRLMINIMLIFLT